MTNQTDPRGAEAAHNVSLAHEEPVVVVVDPRVLIAECFAAALQKMEPSWRFRVLPSLDDLTASSREGIAMVVVCVPSGLDARAASTAASERLGRERPSLPFAIVADDESGTAVLGCIEAGARGYIPTSLTVGIVLQVLRLVQAGCTFVPPNVVRSLINPAEQPATPSKLSGTQLQIADQIRRGTPNKVIAHQLGMSENAVKIQVRSIMKKMKVRNRTELSFRSGHLFV